MTFRFALVAAALLGATAAVAQEREIGYFLAWIGPEDMRSSSGVALDGVGAMIQQDRANFHRFGIRHQYDTDDPFFASREARAQIETLYARGGGAPGYIVQALTRGEPHYVLVRVFGVNGRPTRIEVDEGAG